MLKGLMENSPAGHVLHEAAPVVAENFPPGHVLHTVALLMLEYFPPGHALHDPLGGVLPY
jgi:hypothetical protein